jgi:hypothetical protein
MPELRRRGVEQSGSVVDARVLLREGGGVHAVLLALLEDLAADLGPLGVDVLLRRLTSLLLLLRRLRLGLDRGDGEGSSLRLVGREAEHLEHELVRGEARHDERPVRRDL